MRMRDLWLTALAPAIWGTTYILTTEFLPPNQPFLTALLRALPTGLLITAVCRTLPRGDWWWRAFVLGALNIGLFFAFLFVAAYRLPGGVVATIGAVQPLVVMTLSHLVLDDRAPNLALAAGGLGMIGVGLLVFDTSAQLDALGVLAAAGSVLSMASGIVLTKRWRKPVGLMPFTGWQLVAGGLVLLPMALFFEGLPAELTARNMSGYVWMSLVNTALGYALWFRGIGKLHAYQVSFLGLLSPVVAVLMGYFFLGLGFGVQQWSGVFIILLSIVLVQTVQFRRVHAAPAKPRHLRSVARI